MKKKHNLAKEAWKWLYENPQSQQVLDHRGDSGEEQITWDLHYAYMEQGLTLMRGIDFVQNIPLVAS